MSNALTLFEQSLPPVPADVAAIWGEGNIPERQTVPSLSPGGRRWTVSVDGKKNVVKARVDGEIVEAAVFKGIVLNYNNDRGRAYYEKTFDQDNPAPPDCWSADSKFPDQSLIDAPVAPFEGFTGRCDNCPLAVKGSKVDDRGKETTACSQHKMLAVIPSANLDFRPALRLKLSVTSLWDGKKGAHEDEGWFAFEHYIDYLRKNGIHHSARVVTKMKFDPDVNYPKVLFSPERLLTDDEQRKIAPLTVSAEVKTLLTGFTPNGADGTEINGKAEAPAKVDDAAVKKEAAAAEAKAAAVRIKAEAEAKAKAKAEAEAKAKAEAEAEAKRKAAEEDGEMILDDEEAAPVKAAEPLKATRAPRKASAPKDEPAPPAAAVADQNVPDDVNALLGQWGVKS